jgi:hypothetical protein
VGAAGISRLRPDRAAGKLIGPAHAADAARFAAPGSGNAAGSVKLLFLPISILGGILAGFMAKQLFDLTWRLVFHEEAPEAEHRDVSWPKVLAALALEGAIFRSTRGLVDRASRLGFLRLTGTWPGEEEPEAA